MIGQMKLKVNLAAVNAAGYRTTSKLTYIFEC